MGISETRGDLRVHLASGITWRSMVHEMYVGPAWRGSLGIGVKAGEEAIGSRHPRISLVLD